MKFLQKQNLIFTDQGIFKKQFIKPAGFTSTLNLASRQRRSRKTMPNLVSGFTIIELLVVISVIALLSSVIFASLNNARSKARDARRMSDIKQIQLALELYFDVNGVYPSTSNAWKSGTTVCNSTYGSGNSYSGPTGYIPNLAPNYISVLPESPNVTTNKCYLYRDSNSGKDYKFLIWGAVENYSSTHPLKDPGWGGTGPCTNPRSNTYSIYSSGGICL